MRGAAATNVERAATTELVRCARCGHAVTAQAWRDLPLERTLTGEELGAYVSEWPANAVVEVRACARCGSAAARRAIRR